jgi:hypothetical protein
MSRALDEALHDAGGADAPASATAGLRRHVLAALDEGREELAKKRSGYDRPLFVVIAEHPAGLLAALPVDAAFRADAGAAGPREWVLTAALVHALAEVGSGSPPSQPKDLCLRAGELSGHLVLHLPGSDEPELAALAFDERLEGADRLRARALVVPAAVLEEAASDLRPPIGAGHPLRVAEAVARLGGDPVDPVEDDALEDILPQVLGTQSASARPHEDPDPARRVARRILQRLSGMGKWGGYHTEFAHLPRGFAGNDRALAMEVGESLLQAGLLMEKPSVGQRHVYLNPRRAKDIHRLIDGGDAPGELALPNARE